MNMFGIFTLLAVVACVSGRQKLCVKGKVECPSHPDHGAGQIVKLYDRDTGFNPDDEMAEGATNPDGSFELCGSATDIIGNIDPEIRVYTACKNNGKEEWECYRTLKFHIPTEHIGKTYEFPEPINLDTKRKGEENKCLRGSWIRDIASGELFSKMVKTGAEYFKKGSDGVEVAVNKIEEITT